eukprot:178645_1
MSSFTVTMGKLSLAVVPSDDSFTEQELTLMADEILDDQETDPWDPHFAAKITKLPLGHSFALSPILELTNTPHVLYEDIVQHTKFTTNLIRNIIDQTAISVIPRSKTKNDTNCQVPDFMAKQKKKHKAKRKTVPHVHFSMDHPNLTSKVNTKQQKRMETITNVRHTSTSSVSLASTAK